MSHPRLWISGGIVFWICRQQFLLVGWASYSFINSVWIFQSKISFYLEPSCKRYLDFHIVFDDTQYWAVDCHIYKRRAECEKLPNYPPNSSHFVRYIDYGVDFRIYFPKSGFPEKNGEVRFVTNKPFTDFVFLHIYSTMIIFRSKSCLNKETSMRYRRKPDARFWSTIMKPKKWL